MFGISSVHEKTKQNKKTRHFFTILWGGTKSTKCLNYS